VALACGGAARAQDPASDLNGYVALSSGYWKHGLAQSDGASLQLGIDYQHYTGFFAYARAMNVDYPQNYEGQSRDVEGSAYVGFHRRRAQWSWTASMGRYMYPGTDGYDYDEVSASVGFRDRVFYTASYNDEYYVRGNSALNQEISVAFPLPGDFEVGGAIGYFDVSGGGPEIAHWQVGVSKLVPSSSRSVGVGEPEGGMAPVSTGTMLPASSALNRMPSLIMLRGPAAD
jgi:uncharacterized protein (TIGR02001 family)